jgi:hypothetical protein
VSYIGKVGSFRIYEFEDTEGVIKIRKSKDRQHNEQKKKRQKDKQRPQNIHIKLKIEFTLCYQNKTRNSAFVSKYIS